MNALNKKEHLQTKGRSNRPFDRVFDALVDPTRRAIFERLSPGGEVTVRALTEYFGITQQAVARHLTRLNRAGLVTCRHDGGRTNYFSAHPQGAAPLLDWLAQQGILPRDKKTTRGLARRTGRQRLGNETTLDAIVELRDAYAKAENQYVAAARKAITDRNRAFDKADSELLAAAEMAIQTAVQRLVSSVEAVVQRDRPILGTDSASSIRERITSHH